MSEAKSTLRRLMLARLRGLPKAQAAAWSAEVVARLEAAPAFASAAIVLLYHSLPTEVDVRPLLLRWVDRKRLLLPAVVGDELELRTFTGPDSLAPGAFGILEPTGPAFTDLSAIDLVLVPGVAFDARGGRLGRGKGYYDRLLPRLDRARKWGVCYPIQFVEAVPTDPHDICMDEVITCSLSE